MIVYWPKNLFMVPICAAGKKFINETTKMLDFLTNNSSLKPTALKALHGMPAWLLQKPSKTSKSKDHLAALSRRSELWDDGNISELLYESTTIQERLSNGNDEMNIVKISSKFKDLMQKGNVNGALKLLTNNMSNGILPLTDETLQLLHAKHPESKEATPDVLLQGPIQQVHQVVYDDIDEALVMKAAMKTKGGSGPSGLDADGWRRILVSNSFGNCASNLWKAVAKFIKKLCAKQIEVSKDNEQTLEAFTACRLIHLNKKSGLRPIGISEILRRAAGKVIMSIVKKGCHNFNRLISNMRRSESSCRSSNSCNAWYLQDRIMWIIFINRCWKCV